MERRSVILMVEDNRDARESLASILQDEGYAVAGVGTAAEALDYLEHNLAPQLIVLDLLLPGMSGIEFRMAQLDDPRWKQIPVIVVSAVALDFQRENRLQADAYLLKPVNIDSFLRAVQQFSGADPPPP
jgi:CheY-like chemotaxis protein